MNTGETKPRFLLKRMVPYLILLLIIALGFVMRIYHLQYYLFIFEDSMWYVRTAKLFLRGEWISPNTTEKGPFFTLLLFMFFRILGPTFLVSSLLSILFGILTIAAVYFLGSLLFGKKAGLLAAFIVSINPVVILFSCPPYREAVFSFTFISCLYFAFRGFKGNTIYSILGGIFFALSSMTIETGLFVGVGFLFYYLILNVLKNGERYTCKNLDVFFCSSVLTMIPFLLRNYFAYGDPFKQWVRSILHLTSFAPAIMWAYFGLMALSVPYILFFRVLFTRVRRPSIGRHTKIIRALLIVSAVLMPVAIVAGEVVGIPSLILPIGFIKLMEGLASSESLGFLLIVSILVIAFSLRSSAILGLLCLFLFTSAGFAFNLYSPFNPYHPIWPFASAFRYSAPFIPLFVTLASHGILLFAQRWNSMRVKKRISFIFLIILIIAFQFFYADANVRSRANYDSDALSERYGSIKWLSDHGSPIVYSFNPMLKQIYGEKRVVLLSDESLHDIANRASREGIEYIVVDMLGTYSDAQLALFFRGFKDETWMKLDYFSLVMSNKYWPNDQLYRISLIEPSRTALVVQHADLGQEWVSFLSDRYLVKIVNDEADLAPHFSGDYRLIVLADIMRPLEEDEISVLQERVADGAILIVSGLSPAYLRLEENSQFFGAKVFIEPSKDAKWNITFTGNALNILFGEPPTEKTYQKFLGEKVFIPGSPGDYVILHIDITDELSTLTQGKITVELHDTDLVDEGDLYVNGNGPIDLPVTGNGKTGTFEVDIPVGWLVKGVNDFKFEYAWSESSWGYKVNALSLTILPMIDLSKSYALYSEEPWSSPTGCTGIGDDVVVYAKRAADGATVIFAKPYFKGIVIFSGVRHSYVSNARDRDSYMEFIQNMLEKAYNNTLFTDQ